MPKPYNDPYGIKANRRRIDEIMTSGASSQADIDLFDEEMRRRQAAAKAQALYEQYQNEVAEANKKNQRFQAGEYAAGVGSKPNKWGITSEGGDTRLTNVLEGGLKGSAAAYTNLGGAIVEGIGVRGQTGIARENAQARRETERELERLQTLLERARTDGERQKIREQMDKAQRNMVLLDEDNAAKNRGLFAQWAAPAYAKADALQQKSAEDIEAAKEGLGAFGRFAVDTGVAGVQMLPDTAANLLLPGSGLTMLGLRALGGGMQEARQAGADYEQQLAYGLADASKEVLTEKMFGVFENTYGKGLFDDAKVVKAIKGAVGKLGLSPVGNALLKQIGNGGEEAAEEIVGGFLDPLINSIYNGKSVLENYSELELADILYDGLVGGALGLFGGGSQILNDASYRVANQENAGAVVQEALDIDQENETAKAAQERLQQGKKLSGDTLRTIAGENERANVEQDVTSVQDAVEKRLVELGESEDTAKTVASAVTKSWAGRQVGAQTAAGEAVDLTLAERRALNTSEHAGQVYGELYQLSGAPEWVQGLETKRVKTGTQAGREMTRAFWEAIDKKEGNKHLTVNDTEQLVKEFGEAGAKVFADMAQTDVDERVYYHAFNTAFLYGETGATLDQARDAVANRVQDYVVQAAWAAGKGQADFLSEKSATDMNKRMTGQKVRGPGKVDVRADTGNLNGEQWASINALRKIAEVTGINIVVFQSGTDNGGKFVGKNGEYNPDTNTVEIDVNAGRGNINDSLAPVMLKTAAHELTHFIQENNRDGYDQLKEFVTRHLIEKGVHLEALARKKVERAREAGYELTYEKAIDEVVADACENMLKNTEVIDTLAEENWSLFKFIKKFVDKFHRDLRRAFSKEGYSSKEADLLLDSVEEMQKLWDEAFVRAVQNYQQTGEVLTGEKVDVKPSIRQFTVTAGIEVVQDKKTGKLSFMLDGRPVSRVTAKHIENDSAFGAMIKFARDGADGKSGHISAEEASKQFQAVADLMNTVLNTQNPQMVWEFAGSQLFSAVKSNSDGQYGTTVDFTTVCRKTVEMITAMSERMMTLGRGLTKAEVTMLQRELIEAGAQVPCPVCYVFSRWAGVGSILDNMAKFQAKYADYTDAEIQERIAELKKRNTKAERKVIRAEMAQNDEAYIQLAATRERMNMDKKAFRTQLRKAQKAGDTMLVESLTKSIENADFVAKNAAKQMDEMVKGLDTTAQELSWLERVRSKEGYKPVPKDILFNMASSEAISTFMTEYPRSWSYRTTRGPAAGKAILPYSDMRLGDLTMPLKSKSSDGNTTFADPLSIKGEFNEKQRKAIINAIARVRAQNLIGGQRFQSTSDFRYDYALDYIQAFFEAQMLGSNLQTYTKIVEFGEMVARIGGDVNLSVMPKNKGYENGHLIFSSVTGMDFNAARRLSEMYDSAQLILVGINDEHIRLALEDSEETGGIHIGFVIPYHTSGASIEEFIRALVSNLNEDFVRSNYQDYSDVQTDHTKKAKDVTEDQFHRRDLRKRILTGGEISAQDLALMARDAESATDITGRSFEELLDIENRALAGDQDAIREYESWSAGVLQALYDKMRTQGGSEYGVQLNSKQAEAVMPHEYWDKTTTRDTAYLNGFIFRSYCYNMGLSPRFTGISSKGQVDHGNFRDSRGYWKTLIDRAMYANDGRYRDQRKVNLSEIQAGMITPEYAETYWGEYKVAEPDTERAAKVGRGEKTQRSERDTEYMELAQDPQKNAARLQEMVKKAARDAGYPQEAWHQTGADFTRFNTDNELAGRTDTDTPTGLFFKPNADDIGIGGDKQMHVFIRTGKVLDFKNRDEAHSYWMKNVRGYAGDQADLDAVEAKYQKMYDEADARWDAYYQENYDTLWSDEKTSAGLDEIEKRLDEILAEWRSAEEPIRLRMKRKVTAYMRASGYDSMHLATDGKRYGKNVESFILFDNTGVKSADPVTYDDNGDVVPLSKRFDTAQEDIRYSERDVEAVREYTPQEQRDHIRTAVQHFGTTHNWNEAGYLTTDGQVLDFSGKHDGAPGGYRTVDHRDIKEALGLDYGGTGYSDAMIQFMSEGNIRLMPETGGINLQAEPTDRQYAELRRYIAWALRRDGVALDFDDKNGDTIRSEWYDPSSSISRNVALAGDIINTIRDHYENGWTPKSDLARFREQYSLREVEPVQPSGDGWKRTIDTQEAMRRFPGLWNVTAEESEVRNPTQIKSTVSTYRKIYDMLEAEGFDGTILDASSGLGYGTKAGREEYGFDVDDIEPYPDASYKPRYTDYSKLNKTYDAIISNAVLNVLPQDQRDALVVKMGEMLNPGGKLYVNVRGKDVDTLAAGKGNVNISPMEWYVASTGSYQKGFTKAELKAYLEDALGDGYTVETTSKFGGVAAIVTKNTDATQYSERDTQSYDELQAENDSLRQVIKEFEKEMKAQEKEIGKAKAAAAKWRDKATFSPEKVAKALIKVYNGTIKEGEIHDAVKALVEYAARKNGITYADMKAMALPIARDVIKSSSVLVDQDKEDALKTVKKFMRDNKVKVSQSDINAMNAGVGVESWATFWRKYGFKMGLSTSKGTGVDVAYAELGEQFGYDLFPPSITNTTDQLMRMAEVSDMQPERYNPYSANMAEAIERCANDLIDSVMGEVAQGYKFTYSGQLEEQLYKSRQRTAELLARERARSDAREKALIDYWREQNNRAREAREDSELRQRLLKVARRLKNKKLPTVSRALLNQYLQRDLSEAAQEIFASIDTEAIGMRKSTRLDLEYMRDLYDNLKENDPNFIPDPKTEERIKRLSKRQIETLTHQEVLELTYSLLHIENQIRYEKNLIDSAERREIFEAGLQIIEDLENSKGSAPSGVGSVLDKKFITETLSPERQVRRMTGYVDDDPMMVATRELSAGQRKSFDYKMRALKLFQQFVDNKAFMKRITGKKAETTTIRGMGKNGPVDVEITPAMKIALYLHGKNNQNLTHIAGGGVRVPNMDLYRKGNMAEAYARGTVIKLTPAQVRSIELTADEKRFADAISAYFNGMSRNEVNAVSEKLLGYPVAEVENYFPINTDDAFTRKDFENIKFDGSIEGMGWLKERIKSSSPIFLRDATDVLLRAIDMHSKYVGFAIPVRNFNKLWGVTAKNWTEKGEAGVSSSVQDAVKAKWGETGRKYIAKMMQDVQNGSAEQSEWDKLLAKVRSHYAGAVLTLNGSVAMKQAASYPAAAAIVGWAPLAKALGDFGKVDLDLVAKYTPLLWYRSQGYSTQELGDLTKRGVNLPPVLNWVQGMDVKTTRKLWKAAEYYVRQNNPNIRMGTEEQIQKGESPFYQAVANVYNQIIEETQPNYTTMQRPQLLRSDSTLLQNLQMFKTQPFQNFNVLYDAIGELQARERAFKVNDTAETREALQKAKEKAARATTSLAVQQFVFAAMTALWAVLRGKDDKYKDDEGNTTLLSLLRGVGLDMAGGLFSMVPWGGDVWEFGSSAIGGKKYYGIDDVTTSALSDAGKATINAGKYLSGILTGKITDPNEIRLKMDKVADAVSKLAGVPYENVMNLANAIYRQGARALEGNYMGQYDYLKLTTDPNNSSDKAAYYDLLYQAYKNDRNAHAELYRQMVADGWDPDNIKSGMENRMKKDQGVSSVKDLSSRYTAP